MTATVPTSDEFASLAALVNTQQGQLTALATRVTALEADGPLEPPPVVVPPPTGGVLVTSNASLLAALAAHEPLIKVKAGTILKPLNPNTSHGGTAAVPCVVQHETGGPIPVDLGGVSSRGFAYLSYGSHDIVWKRLAPFNGNVEQMGLFSIGDGTTPPPSKRLTFEDTIADASITGPATPGSTAAATAHFCYVSKATALHEDITFRRSISHGKGLAAMWHLYAAGSGCLRFVADTWEAYGHSQVVMSFAGTFANAQILNGYAEGCGYVVRAPVGSGTVTARAKGTINRLIHPDTTASWGTAGVVAV